MPLTRNILNVKISSDAVIFVIDVVDVTFKTIVLQL
jgi:hypothetical protein